jgi:hypothetical protein
MNNWPFARLLATQDNTDTEESRHTRYMDTPIGFQIRGHSDRSVQIMHIFNRMIPVVDMSK